MGRPPADPVVTPQERRYGSSAILGTLALVLVIIGGLNWGLVGLFRFDVVAAIFGPMSTVTRVVYVLVGLAAIYCAISLPRWSRAS